MVSNSPSVGNRAWRAVVRFYHQMASPPHFCRWAERLAPWFAWSAALCLVLGLYGGLVLAPEDDEMRDGFRIIYVHVPSAYMSMMVYSTMAIAAAVGLIWRMKLAYAVAAACALPGAAFTFLSLVTGSIWGRPMWGTWWEWDGRMTAQLVLLFLFLGYMALRNAYQDTQRADRASAILAIVGVINLPIIKYSVVWWNTLHQPATIGKLDKPSMAWEMLWPLLIMILGYTLFWGALMMWRVQTEVLNRERNSKWIKEYLVKD